MKRLSSFFFCLFFVFLCPVWRIVGIMNNHYLFSESTLRRLASPCSCGVRNRPRVDKLPPPLCAPPPDHYGNPRTPTYNPDKSRQLICCCCCCLPTIYSTYFSSLQHALPHCYHSCDNKTPKMAPRHRAHTERSAIYLSYICHKPLLVRGRPGLRCSTGNGVDTLL